MDHGDLLCAEVDVLHLNWSGTNILSGRFATAAWQGLSLVNGGCAILSSSDADKIGI